MTRRHILVPLALGRRAAPALAIVRELAAQRGARVTLLHVVQRIEHVPEREVRDFYRRLAERAERFLAGAAQPLVRDGIPVARKVVVGDPPAAILRHAETSGATLLVMDSHRIVPGRPGYGLGTTSYKVALLCRCPVLLVK